MAAIGKSLADSIGSLCNTPTFAPKFQKNMSQSIIIWCTIAGVLSTAFVIRAIKWYYTKCRRIGRKPWHHIIEMGKESEMFFVPGDVIDKDVED